MLQALAVEHAVLAQLVGPNEYGTLNPIDPPHLQTHLGTSE